MTLRSSLHIPSELRARPQWISWRYENTSSGKPTKIPLNSRTGHKADITNPDQWSEFSTARDVAHACDGVGFCFSPNDPYCGLDLDGITSNPAHIQSVHEKVFNALDSYSELSPSGKGVHIITKASVPAGRNSRKWMMECYSANRFFTFTGNVIRNVLIAERQELITDIWKGLGDIDSATVSVIESPQLLEDKGIYERAASADNGGKFAQLWAGHWQGDYPSQSEADQALVDILQFYTKNVQQIARLFRTSGLGQREKAKRDDYVNRTIRRAFDRELPTLTTIDYSVPKAGDGQVYFVNGNSGPSLPAVARIDPRAMQSPFQMPEGLVGEIAKFILAAAPRPITEAAIAAAIVVMSGIVGRAYNVHGAGLNQYVIFMGRTAIGKEAMASGASKLMNEICKQVPVAEGFRGPSDLASGQGLNRHLSKSQTKSCFSIIGEFGIRLQSLTGDNDARGPEKALYSALLQLYGKSGKGNQYEGVAYADADKNIGRIESPAFSLLGEGVMESFYQSLEERHVTSGLLPRFTFIEYTGDRPYRNKMHAYAKPDKKFLDDMCSLAAISAERLHRNVIEDIKFSEAAEVLDDNYNEECDARIRATDRSVIRDIWSRAYLKVAKLAAVVAIGRNYMAPMIDESDYVWARNIIEFESKELVKRFSKGNIVRDINNLEQEQLVTVARILITWVDSEFESSNLQRTNQAMHRDKLIMVSDVMMRTALLNVFKKDKYKEHKPKLERALEKLKMMGYVEEAPATLYGKMARAVKVIDGVELRKFVANFE